MGGAGAGNYRHRKNLRQKNEERKQQLDPKVYNSVLERTKEGVTFKMPFSLLIRGASGPMQDVVVRPNITLDPLDMNVNNHLHLDNFGQKIANSLFNTADLEVPPYIKVQVGIAIAGDFDNKVKLALDLDPLKFDFNRIFTSGYICEVELSWDRVLQQQFHVVKIEEIHTVHVLDVGHAVWY